MMRKNVNSANHMRQAGGGAFILPSLSRVRGNSAFSNPQPEKARRTAIAHGPEDHRAAARLSGANRPSEWGAKVVTLAAEAGVELPADG